MFKVRAKKSKQSFKNNISYYQSYEQKRLRKEILNLKTKQIFKDTSMS